MDSPASVLPINCLLFIGIFFVDRTTEKALENDPNLDGRDSICKEIYVSRGPKGSLHFHNNPGGQIRILEFYPVPGDFSRY